MDTQTIEGKKVLHLILKKKWFDMIASGEKKEEYREVKPYWVQRLTWHEFHKCDLLELLYREIESDVYRHDFDLVCFHNGYSKSSPAMTFYFKGIYIGFAKPEWSDNWQGDVFVIKLGEITNP